MLPTILASTAAATLAHSSISRSMRLSSRRTAGLHVVWQVGFLEGEDGLDVEAVGLVEGHAARRGVRARQVVALFELGDVVADGGRADAESTVARNAVGRYGRRRVDVVIDDEPEDDLLAWGNHRSRRDSRRGALPRRRARKELKLLELAKFSTRTRGWVVA